MSLQYQKAMLKMTQFTAKQIGTDFSTGGPAQGETAASTGGTKVGEAVAKEGEMLIRSNPVDDVVELTQSQLNTFAPDMPLERSRAKKILWNILKQGFWPADELQTINDLLRRAATPEELGQYYDSVVTHPRNAERVKAIQSIGNFSKERYSGESDIEYLERMLRLAQQLPTKALVTEEQRMKERNRLRANLTKIASPKDVARIMNDSQLQDAHDIAQINDVWANITKTIRENYSSVSPDDMVEIMLAAKFRTDEKYKKGYDVNNVVPPANPEEGPIAAFGIQWGREAKTGVLLDETNRKRVTSTFYNTSPLYRDIRTTFRTVTLLKEHLAALEAGVAEDDSVLDELRRDYDAAQAGFSGDSPDISRDMVPWLRSSDGSSSSSSSSAAAVDPDDGRAVTGDGFRYRGRGVNGLFKSITKTRTVRGRGTMAKVADDVGIKPKSAATHAQFGKYLLSLERLDKSQLRVVYDKTHGNIKSLPLRTISEDMRDLLEQLVLSGKFNERLFLALKGPERSLTQELLTKSGVAAILRIKLPDNKDEMEAKRARFELLSAQVNAGNDSPLHIEEMREILGWLRENGHMGTHSYNKMMRELN